jgi:ribonuclease HI
MYSLYFDGASKGNPGPSGCGGIIIDHNKNSFENNITYKYYLQKQTNNYAEYMGLYYGLLHAVKLNIKILDVFGDSKLVISQCSGAYKVKNKKLLEIYNLIKSLEAKFDKIEYFHVYRENNKIADKLANEAIV